MKHVASRDNPGFKRLRALMDDARFRREQQATLLDGVHLIAAALEAKVFPRRVAVMASARQVPEISALLQCLPDSCEQLELSDALLRAVSPVETPSGIVAEVAIPAVQSMSGLQDVLVLAGVQDTGNLGTLLRTAAAAGIRYVWLDEHCAQAWSPKVLRAGMGAHFQLSLQERANLHVMLSRYVGRIVATALSPTAQSLYSLDLKSPTAWLFGSEGRGVPSDLLARAQLNVVIPMPGGMESLNVAAAAAICLFEQVRQRLALVHSLTVRP